MWGTVVAVLRRAGRRDLEGRATTIQQIFTAQQLRQPRPVQAAYAVIVSSQVQLINLLNIEIAEPGNETADHFGRHRDAERYLNLPGLGVVLAPGSSASSATTRTATPTRKHAATTPAPHRSPAPPAVAGLTP
jgi:hypothetical protein